MQGMVFDIQRLCVHDGPGIRTTVFLKGCSLRCFWCHNPESLERKPQLMLFEDRCIHCGRCAEACEQQAHSFEGPIHTFHRSRCKGCGLCAELCAAKALVMSGQNMSERQVLEEIVKDRSFYNKSGGGVTFSGGEPLLQIDFLEGLLRGCREQRIHTAIETAGNVDWECFARVMPYTDLFLYDVKVLDADQHQRVTGADNRRILENLKKLALQGAHICVRIPVIPGVNDSKEAIGAIAEFVRELPGTIKMELMPFHLMGRSKYRALGYGYEAAELEPPEDETIQELRRLL